MDVILTIVAIFALTMFALINCYLAAMIFYLVKDIYNEITKEKGDLMIVQLAFTLVLMAFGALLGFIVVHNDKYNGLW